MKFLLIFLISLSVSAANFDTGFICASNSTTTALAANTTYVGTAEDVSQYSIVTYFIDTDQDGTISVQFSTDGTNWDRTKAVPIDQSIGSGSVHTVEVVSQYMRVVVANGSVTQGHLRLQTIAHKFKSGFITSSPDQVISKVDDAQLIRVANDPVFDISRSLYADKTSIRKFGHNEAVPSGSFADVWDNYASSSVIGWATTDEKFRVKAGGHAEDSPSNVGARTIQIVYLDSTGVQQQDQLTLQGSSASDQTSATGRRFIRAWVDTTGTIKGNNTGKISIENVSTGLVVGTIGAGAGQSETTGYTIPLDYTCYLKYIIVDIAVGTNKDCDVRMWQRRDAYTVAAPFGAKRIVRGWDDVQGSHPVTYHALPFFPALTDLWFEGTCSAESEISVEYDLFCIKGDNPTTPQ